MVVKEITREDIKALLYDWGRWCERSGNAYPAMSTVGRAMEYGVGGKPGYRSMPPRNVEIPPTYAELMTVMYKIERTVSSGQALMGAVRDRYISNLDPDEAAEYLGCSKQVYLNRLSEGVTFLTLWYNGMLFNRLRSYE